MVTHHIKIIYLVIYPNLINEFFCVKKLFTSFSVWGWLNQKSAQGI